MENRVLVVEDNPDLLMGIRDVLEGEGYTVLTAANGMEALKGMEGDCPDLIVADIMMPKVNGYELYEAVRNRPEWLPIPFIFLTAKATKADVLKGKSLGAEDYIVKPFEPQELLVAVRSRLDRARAVQDVAQAEFERLKRQIVTILGHELRTPLTYVQGYTDLALEEVACLPPGDLEQFLLGIQHGANRLTQLVKDLLLLVQLDTGQAAQDFLVRAEECEDLNLVVAHTVQNYEEKAAAAGVTLNTALQDNLPPIRLYTPFFVEALGRLVDNGIKFSRSEGQCVTTSVQAKDGWMEIAVSDEGIGIAPNEFPHLFKRFQQIDRDRLEQQGLGLGLPIAQALIRLHGGDITVESTLGRGSTFTIRLPTVA